jgi:sensor c-di-GMP phosphodiesterase-like protein
LVTLWSRRRRILVGAVGLALVVAPVFGARWAIERATHNAALTNVSEIATEFVARADLALASGANALDRLTLGQVSQCGPRALAAMREIVTSVLPVKVLAITDGGRIICNQFGMSDSLEALSPAVPADDGITTLRLARLRSSGASGVLVTRPNADGTDVSALIAREAIAGMSLPRPIRGTAAGALTLVGGTMISAFQPPIIDPRVRPAGDAPVVSAQITSQRFPIAMRLSVPESTFAAANAGLLTTTTLGGGVISTLIFALLIYLLRRPPDAIARMIEAETRGEFAPYYQPVVNIVTGRLVGCEVLVRWIKPDGSIVAPDMFIHLAESSGLAAAMTLSVMNAVRRDLERAFGQRPHLTIAINLFNAHFSRLRTVSDVERAFRGTAIAPSQLVFELTERLPLRSVARARVVIRQLQAMGARVALDDAGTGHSGLAHLQQLGVDIVKIDKFFVDTIGAGETAAPIVDSLIRLGHDLGLEVVAEGVETFEQLDYLRRHGADHAQGYLFSPPMPARAFLDLVEAMEPLGDEAAKSMPLDAPAEPPRAVA